MDKKDLPFLTWEERNKVKEAARLTKDSGGTIVPLDSRSDLPFLSWEERNKIKEASDIQRSVRDTGRDDLEGAGEALFNLPLLIREALLEKGHYVLALLSDSIFSFLWYKVTMFTIDIFFTYGFPKEFFTSGVYFTTYLIPIILVLAFGFIFLLNGVHAVKDVGYIIRSIFTHKKKITKDYNETECKEELKETNLEPEIKEAQEEGKEEIIINLFKEKPEVIKEPEEPLFVVVPEPEPYEDPLLDKVIEYISKMNQISEQTLQKEFNISYKRANNILLDLEDQGIVTKRKGNSRTVLITYKDWMDM